MIVWFRKGDRSGKEAVECLEQGGNTEKMQIAFPYGVE